VPGTFFLDKNLSNGVSQGLSQNFSFWRSCLGFKGKGGFWTVFSAVKSPARSSCTINKRRGGQGQKFRAFYRGAQRVAGIAAQGIPVEPGVEP
jgi:hypothetical protein